MCEGLEVASCIFNLNENVSGYFHILATSLHMCVCVCVCARACVLVGKETASSIFWIEVGWAPQLVWTLWREKFYVPARNLTKVSLTSSL